MPLARTTREFYRRGAAFALLGLASFGLVAAPLLHAEQHALEAEGGDTDVLVKRLHQRGADFDEVFARLWDYGRHTPAHKHSHGPAGRRGHGDGSLQHFALAVHGPPPPLPLPAALPLPQAVAAKPCIEAPAARRHTPERAQAPPLA
ncbi:MAG TPA: hypothetical protein VLW85_19590 [Myxococcales bacterium]|nr:hypothetical protein [Myxococcales bacterium]